MYIYDQNKLIKVRADASTRPIGVVPPSTSPSADFGPPAMAVLDDGQDITGWNHSGNISSITLNDREGTGVTSGIGNILYNSGATGWACLNPTSASPVTWAGNRTCGFC